MADAKRARAKLAMRTRLGLQTISKRANKTGIAVRTVMLKNKRQLLMGKKLTEEEMTILYDKELERGR